MKAHPGNRGTLRPTAGEIDDCLHAERVTADRTKRTFLAALEGLPDGIFVTVRAWGEKAFLVRGDRLLEWSPGGYRDRRPRPRRQEVQVLTPKSTAEAIKAGYQPEVHSSAEP
jgi:hypothetical protein